MTGSICTDEELRAARGPRHLEVLLDERVEHIVAFDKTRDRDIVKEENSQVKSSKGKI